MFPQKSRAIVCRSREFCWGVLPFLLTAAIQLYAEVGGSRPGEHAWLAMAQRGFEREAGSKAYAEATRLILQRIAALLSKDEAERAQRLTEHLVNTLPQPEIKSRTTSTTPPRA
jgi:hypothetical protein